MLFILPFFLVLTASDLAQAGEVRVSIEALPSMRGEILYLIFSEESGFPDEDEKSYLQGSLSLSEGKRDFILSLPNGKYALSVIHDENSNDKLDTGVFGIPKEAFGFSNNPTIYFGPPSFKKASFKVRGDSKLTIKMKTM